MFSIEIELQVIKRFNHNVSNYIEIFTLTFVLVCRF